MSLSEQQRALRLRYRDDLEFYARHCLSIRTKGATLERMVFNRAQRYVHARLEQQRKDTGKVRALILKGRQQGCCYAPEMRVLTTDYRWIKIADVKVGDHLIGVDEDASGITAAGRKTERRIRSVIIEAKAILQKPIFKVTLDNGVILRVTGEHRHLCKQRGGCVPQWRTVQDTKIGDEIRSICCPPNGYGNTFEDGWFGGLLDGEGSFGASPAVRISISQINGPVLKRAKDYLNSRGIRYYELVDRRCNAAGYSKIGDKPVHCLRIDRLSDVLYLLTITRPSRFVGRKLFEGKKLPKTAEGFQAWPKVTSIESDGFGEVIDLQTSEKTFICEGIVSHNSTYVGARLYHRVTHSRGTRVFILTHEDPATQNLFEMVKRFHGNCPEDMRPTTGAANANELKFTLLDSEYKVGTAGSKGVGRSSTIHLFHGSEAALWPHAESHAAGILQAVPDMAGTEVILESTANGMGNLFHQKWRDAEAGKGDFIPIFVPWFWQDEYQREPSDVFALDDKEQDIAEAYGLSLAQMAWRRNKISELKDEMLYMQEYPNCAAEAFQTTGHDSFIKPELVLKARKARCEAYGPLIVGVDPARFGDDAFAVAWRQGRKLMMVERKYKIDVVTGANWVKQIIDVDMPDRVFVDVGGLGAGIVDILRSWGGKYAMLTKPINFGGEPQEAVKVFSDGRRQAGPRNRRAEMWERFRDWLAEEGGADIPDDDALQADLCGPGYSYDMNQRLLLESKEHMRARGMASPDSADAAVLTMAEPVEAKPELWQDDYDFADATRNDTTGY